MGCLLSIERNHKSADNLKGSSLHLFFAQHILHDMQLYNLRPWPGKPKVFCTAGQGIFSSPSTLLPRAVSFSEDFQNPLRCVAVKLDLGTPVLTGAWTRCPPDAHSNPYHSVIPGFTTL